MSEITSQPQSHRAESVASESSGSSSQASMSRRGSVQSRATFSQDGSLSPPSLDRSDMETVTSAESDDAGGPHGFAQPAYGLNQSTMAPTRRLTVNNLLVLGTVEPAPSYSALENFVANTEDARLIHINLCGGQSPCVLHGKR